MPSGFGHEFSGIVAKVDENVKNVKVGDRVVCANSAPCGECFYCRREEFELCENLDLLNGAYAEYIVIPKRIVEKNTLIIPDNLSFAKAAFSEPLSNVVHGIAKTPIQKGDVVGVRGRLSTRKMEVRFQEGEEPKTITTMDVIGERIIFISSAKKKEKEVDETIDL